MEAAKLVKRMPASAPDLATRKIISQKVLQQRSNIMFSKFK